MVLVCATAAFATLPATAAAGGQIELHPGGMELRIPLGIKHHYFLSLSADDGQRVKILADELFSSAAYSVEGRVSSSRIEADFGPLGRIDVKVRLHHGRSAPPVAGEHCKGRPAIIFRGTYRGTIAFAGERDVPAVNSRHGRVSFIRRFRRVCVKPQPPSEPGRPSAIELGLLTVNGHGEGRTSSFQAFDLASKRNPSLSFGIFLAEIHERTEQVRIDRSTFGFAGGKELLMSKRGKGTETFRVKLEKPFSGKAVFFRDRQSPSTWTGDLAVKLPGATPAPLTGPDFSTSLCRASSSSRVETCFAESNPLIGFRNDFLSQLLDTYRAAVKTSNPSIHPKGSTS